MTLSLATAAINVPRDSHYVLNPASGLYERSLLVELSSTNLNPRSESDSSWTAGGATPPTVDSQNATVDGIVCTQTTFPVTVGGTFAGCNVRGSLATIVAGTTYIWSAWLKLSRPLVAGESLQFYMTGSTALLPVFLTSANSATWQSWAPIISPIGGIVSPSSGQINFTIFPITLNSPLTIYCSRRQLEVGPFPTSYIPTTTVAVTRSSDSPFWLPLPADFTPQAFTLYVKFIELGTSLCTSNVRLLNLGEPGSASKQFEVASNGTGKYFAALYNGASEFPTGGVGNAPNYGDQVELRATVGADATVSLTQTLNNGAESAAVAAAGALPDVWSSQRLYVGGSGVAVQTGCAAFLAIKMQRGIQSLAQMRAF